MAKRGAKVERNTVNSSEEYELEYEAKKQHTSTQKVKEAKKEAGSNKRQLLKNN